MQHICTIDTLNDFHRATKMKQPHANNAKKSRKPKVSSDVTTQGIFQNMQEQVRSRLACCEPGRELEVNKCIKKVISS